MEMDVRKQSGTAWLLLTFTLPTKRASQRVEVWRKLRSRRKADRGFRWPTGRRWRGRSRHRRIASWNSCSNTTGSRRLERLREV